MLLAECHCHKVANTRAQKDPPPSFLVLVFGIWHEASGRANPLGFFIIQNFKPLKKKKKFVSEVPHVNCSNFNTHCILFEKRKKNEANPHFLWIFESEKEIHFICKQKQKEKKKKPSLCFLYILDWLTGYTGTSAKVNIKKKILSMFSCIT